MHVAAGLGETELAQYITAWLEHRDIETHCLQPTKGRPSVVGVAKGIGGGRSLMLNGHMGPVTVSRCGGETTSRHVENGKLYGLDAADRKRGLAVTVVAVAQARRDRLPGDVIFTGVAHDEDGSIGTERVLEAD